MSDYFPERLKTIENIFRILNEYILYNDKLSDTDVTGHACNRTPACNRTLVYIFMSDFMRALTLVQSGCIRLNILRYKFSIQVLPNFPKIFAANQDRNYAGVVPNPSSMCGKCLRLRSGVYVYLFTQIFVFNIVF
jgi:hypothetical protein